MTTRTHRSFRFDPATLQRLDQRARQTGLTRTALVERYVDEGLRQADHPGIVFVDEPAGRRARVAGTGLDVWEVVATVRDNKGSIEGAATYLAVPKRMVAAAMGYYAEYPHEIDAWIEETDRLHEEEALRVRRVAETMG